MLYLSRGSNYTFLQAWRHFLTIGGKSSSDRLKLAMVERFHGKKALLYARGRDALSMAVRLATGGSGRVAVPSLTCYSVVEAVRAAGCEVVYVESDSKTLQFSPKNLLKTCQEHKIKAVIVQNTFGIAVDIDEIMKITKRIGAKLIEDVAHSVGGKYADGRVIGSVGDYTMLSFGRDKLLDTINGGALVIRTGEVGSTLTPPLESPGLLRSFRDRIYPLIAHLARLLTPIKIGKYVIAISYKLGLAVRAADGGADFSMKLPNWQAKLALEQMNNLDQNIANRLEKQQLYLEKLADFSPATSSNAIRLPLLVKNRDQVLKKLAENGYLFGDVWYDVPVIPERLEHLAYFPKSDMPVAMKLSDSLLNLPTHQLVKQADIDKISEIILEEAEPWRL